MTDDIYQAIREAGGIIHGNGNIFFTNFDVFNKACAAFAPHTGPAVAVEPIYQITQPFSDDPPHTWRDASEQAYDMHMPKKRRIVQVYKKGIYD